MAQEGPTGETTYAPNFKTAWLSKAAPTHASSRHFTMNGTVDLELCDIALDNLYHGSIHIFMFTDVHGKYSVTLNKELQCNSI